VPVSHSFMQISAASLRMHAACVALPLKAPVSAWSATRRLAANKSSRTFLHTVQAAEQRAAGEDPSNVDIKGRSNEDKQAKSTYMRADEVPCHIAVETFTATLICGLCDCFCSLFL